MRCFELKSPSGPVASLKNLIKNIRLVSYVPAALSFAIRIESRSLSWTVAAGARWGRLRISRDMWHICRHWSLAFGLIPSRRFLLKTSRDVIERFAFHLSLCSRRSSSSRHAVDINWRLVMIHLKQLLDPKYRLRSSTRSLNYSMRVRGIVRCVRCIMTSRSLRFAGISQPIVHRFLIILFSSDHYCCSRWSAHTFCEDWKKTCNYFRPAFVALLQIVSHSRTVVDWRHRSCHDCRRVQEDPRLKPLIS